MSLDKAYDPIYTPGPSIPANRVLTFNSIIKKKNINNGNHDYYQTNRSNKVIFYFKFDSTITHLPNIFINMPQFFTNIKCLCCTVCLQTWNIMQITYSLCYASHCVWKSANICTNFALNNLQFFLG